MALVEADPKKYSEVERFWSRFIVWLKSETFDKVPIERAETLINGVMNTLEKVDKAVR